MKKKEYMTKFLDLLRYVLYIKDERAKIQRFVSGLPLAFKDEIEYDEPQLLEEVIGKLKHYYEQSKCKKKSQQGWKGKEMTKGKCTPKKTRPQDAGENENVVPYKTFTLVG